tara:strand:+ start:175 stop:342 length:168 start_codon:yes stop_codon:yes gene_type:complete
LDGAFFFCEKNVKLDCIEFDFFVGCLRENDEFEDDEFEDDELEDDEFENGTRSRE